MGEREIRGSPGYTSLHHMPLQESGGFLGLERAHGGRLNHGVSCCCSCRHLGSHMWISNTQQAVPSKAYSRRGLSSPPVMLFCRLCCFLLLCLWDSLMNSPVHHQLHFLWERRFILYSTTCSDNKIHCGDRMRQYLSWELWQLVQHTIQQDLFPFTGKFENSGDYFAEQML